MEHTLSWFLFKQAFLCVVDYYSKLSGLWTAQRNCQGTDARFWWDCRRIQFAQENREWCWLSLCQTLKPFAVPLAICHHILFISMQLMSKLNNAFRTSNTFLRSAWWRILSTLVITVYMPSYPIFAITSWIVKLEDVRYLISNQS